MLQQTDVGGAVLLGNTGRFDKGANRFGRVATTAIGGQCGHTRVIPAAYVALLDHTHERTLGHHGVGQVQARKLDLAGREDAQLLDEPVVKRTVAFVLE